MVRGTEGDNLEPQYSVSKLVDDDISSITHLASYNGSVYMGARNRLFKLDSNLTVNQVVRTGPETIFSSRDGPIDNFNKVLIVNHFNDELIICGNAYDGSCDSRQLNDISVIVRKTSERIVLDEGFASTVAVIVKNLKEINFLLIGVSSIRNSRYRNDVPVIASRHLEDNRFLEIAVSLNCTFPKSSYIQTVMGSSYSNAFVHGFTTGDYTIFITRRKETILPESPVVSNLVRFPRYSISASYYKNYSFGCPDIPLQCFDSEGNLYNLVQAAYVTRLGGELSAELGIGVEDDVLFATFASSDSPGSVICRYTLGDFNFKITKVI